MNYPNPKYRYHILTYGCQMNVRDSEIISGLLVQEGYVELARCDRMLI